MISKALDIKTFKYKKIKDWVNTRIVSDEAWILIS